METKVDVVVCTYNSEKYLDACLKSINKNIPVNDLIIVDKFSEDKTQEIAINNNALIYEFNGSLAESRKHSFNLATTPLLVNVDSDVVLCKDWYNKVIKYWNSENIGALYGITIDQHPLQKAYTEAMFKLKPAASYKVFRLPNCIFKTNVVKDIQFCAGLKYGSVANEDYAIRDWILKKGYKNVIAPVFSKHYSNPPLIDSKTFWFGASSRITKQWSFKDFVFRTFFSIPQSMIISLVSHNALLIPYWIKYRFQIMNGYLNWNKYFNYKRNAN